MSDRSWDQLILALYRDTAIVQGERLRLDYGRRSELLAETSANSPGVAVGEVKPAAKRRINWEDFTGEVASIAGVPSDRIHAETRILEDLGLDSLALAELAVVLVEKYDMWSVSKQLETRTWADVTVRDLFDEYLTRVPVKKQPSVKDS
jgi:acyl carrier protein